MTTYHHILQQADALRQLLDRLSPLKEADEQRLWQKLRLEWNSNYIEGNTVTYGETRLLLLFSITEISKEPFKYKIHTPDAPKKPFSKLYSQALNQDEQERIVNAVGAYVWEQIERNRKID
jgi:hypothetical protein